MTETDFAYAAVTVVLLFSIGAMWYAQWTITKATNMLRHAGDYWRRSVEVWDAIDATPGENITEEALRKMEAFLDEETDQVGSIPSDYHRAKDTPGQTAQWWSAQIPEAEKRLTPGARALSSITATVAATWGGLGYSPSPLAVRFMASGRASMAGS